MLPHIEELALKAGMAIMKIYEKEITPKYKNDFSPVTEADVIAENIIIAGLKTIAPEVPIIAEESFSSGHSPNINKNHFWLVDPLDGTHEFVEKNDEFTVNIGLIEDKRPICGVVHAPVLQKTYSGIVGVGAHYRFKAGQPKQINIRPAPKDGVTIVSSRRHGDKMRIETLLEGRRIKKMTTMGSSLKFCIVAEGNADLYPRFGRTMEWDTAAGQAVLEAAGGRVTTLNVAPFRYAKFGFENPHFIAWGGITDPNNFYSRK